MIADSVVHRLLAWGPLRTVIARTYISRAIVYSLTNQLWMGLMVPLVAVAIAQRLSPDEQGLYYTFASVIVLQMLVELGLSTVITQTASHDWAMVKGSGQLSAVRGNTPVAARLSALFRFSAKWYLWGAALVGIGLSVGGYIFFSLTHPSGRWEGPWVLLCCGSGAALLTVPFMALLEGCNKVAEISAGRLLQNIAQSLTLIFGLLGGAALYAPGLAALVRLAVGCAFIVSRYRNFFWGLFRIQAQPLNWLGEIWPFQWRIAVSWAAGALVSAAIVPVVFASLGATVAGQLGMTLSFVFAVETACFAWINTRVPEFGMLIAHARYDELDDLFQRLRAITLMLSLVAALVLIALRVGIEHFRPELSLRLLPLLPVALLLAQRILSIQVSAMAAYLRAHKREPLAWLSLGAAVLTVVVAVCLTRQSGVIGLAAGWFAVTALWTLPITLAIFRRSKLRWHVKCNAPQTVP